MRVTVSQPSAGLSATAESLDLSRVRDALYDAGVAEDAAEQVIALLECLHAPPRASDADLDGLTPQEKRLVLLLRARPGRVMVGEALAEALRLRSEWSGNNLKVLVANARRKNPRLRERIVTHWGEGYSWSAE